MNFWHLGLNGTIFYSDTSVQGDCPMLKTVLQSYDALNASEADILNATQLVQLISEAKLLGLTLETLRVGYLFFV